MADDKAFPKHNSFYHGIYTDCGQCTHPAKCKRFTAEQGYGTIDLCAPCVAEGHIPDDYTLGMWCTECSDIAEIERSKASSQ